MGDVFTFSFRSESRLKSADRIKATRIWSLRRLNMAGMDVAIGQNDTVIISTQSGCVWTCGRRPKPKIKHDQETKKEFKFARLGRLTRIVAVRANNAGAYAVLRNDVEPGEIEIEKSSLGRDLIMGIPFGQGVEALNKMNFDSSDSEGSAVAVGRGDDRLWADQFVDLSPLSESCDAILVVQDDYRLYFQKAILACRSQAFRDFLENPSSTEFEVDSINGIMEVHLDGIGIVAAAQFIHYIYTDELMEKLMPILPPKDNNQPERMEIVRQLYSLAAKFHLEHLSVVLKPMSYNYAPPERSLQKHLQNFRAFETPDAILCLADQDIPCHSIILAARCPFFGAMFDKPGLGGGWLGSRRRDALAEGISEVRIQLKHLPNNIMSLVLDHIYWDGGREMFENVQAETVDEFLEFVIEVLAAADELLLNRLKDICQSILPPFGNSLIEDGTDDSDIKKCCHNIGGGGHVLSKTVERCVSQLLCIKYRSSSRESVLVFIDSC